MTINRFVLKDYIINTYINNGKSKTIILLTYNEDEKEIYKIVEKEYKDPFNMVIISNIKWNDDLSISKLDPIYKGDSEYKGNAKEFLNFIENELYLYLKKEYSLDPSSMCIGGYSLAGLFSLYALNESRLFDSALSVSGSLWFPGFDTYIKNSSIKNDIKLIYLSLGDKEPLSKNEYMSKVGIKTIEIYEYYKNNHINIFFEYNDGGHFNGAINRQAKAVLYYLKC